MTKRFITVLFLTLSLVLSGVAQLSTVSAQGAQEVPYNQSPATNNGQGGTGTTTTNNDNTGFDWRWLLPLLIIPVIYLLTRKKDNDDRSEYRNERYSGAKGGQSRRNQDDEL